MILINQETSRCVLPIPSDESGTYEAKYGSVIYSLGDGLGVGPIVEMPPHSDSTKDSSSGDSYGVGYIPFEFRHFGYLLDGHRGECSY